MKSLVQKWGITFSVLILMVHFAAQYLGEAYHSIEIISKALLLPSLMLFLAVHPNVSGLPGKNLVMLGLFGSFLGDVLLINKSLFIPGMIAFMMTHIFNIVFFIKMYGPSKPKSTKLYISTFLLLLFCCFIYLQLKDGTKGNLIYPILAYMVLICTSTLMTIHISNHSPVKIFANTFWIPGMVFFLTSDAILALNKFNWSLHTPVKNIGLLIMVTYGLAQLFMVKGFQVYFSQTKKNDE
ncbi:MAG: lysoplasmalogenase family protein [Sediminibacterium sp.]|jgi:hypothetical protein